MKRLLVLIILISIKLSLSGQENLKTGIIYGYNIAFSLTAPDGWVLDNKAGARQGLYAVFYRNGESWEKAEAVMYANTATFQDNAHRALHELINYDIEFLRRNFLGIKIENIKDIVIKDNIVAKVKHVSGKSYGNFEAKAYIDAGKEGVMIILISRTKNDFENSLNSFESLVKSYLFISYKVDIEKKNK